MFSFGFPVGRIAFNKALCVLCLHIFVSYRAKIRSTVNLIKQSSGQPHWVLGMQSSDASMASDSQAISQEVVRAMDAVCATVSRLESMKSNFDLFYKLFDGNCRLAYEFSCKGDKAVCCSAQDGEEASVMFALAKCASLGLPLSAMQVKS